MKDLFYSPTEKLLFWVAGYTDNTENVNKLVKMLDTLAMKFANKVLVKKSDVRTTFVTHSRRYKQMRVFYVKTDHAPKKAFSIGSDKGWTMNKWLEG